MPSRPPIEDPARPVPAFLALAAPALSGGGPGYTPSHAADFDPLVFSPRAMQWSATIWLFDLTPCRRYWRLQSEQKQLTPAALLTHMAAAALGLQVSATTGPDGAYQLIAADHPWLAVLFAAFMQERQLSGYLDLREAFGRNLLAQVSWSAWLATAADYGRHCCAVKMPKFQPTVFQQQLKHLQAAMQRLGQTQTTGLATGASPATQTAMRRRFGAHLAQVWDWTLATPASQPAKTSSYRNLDPGAACRRDSSADGLPAGFPWQAYAPTHKPTLTRHLETPVWEWDHLALYLCADFDRLLESPAWTPHSRLSHLLWTLHCDDGSDLAIDVRFRHPHRLHAEQGTHKTALTQAAYSFAASFGHAAAQADETGIARVPIIGWTLTVEGQLTRPSFNPGLFATHGNAGDEVGDEHQELLLHLENQLPLALERYGLVGGWLPETSFARHEDDTAERPVQAGNQLDASWEPWLAAAKNRPLYLYTKPLPLASPPTLGQLRFAERIQEKWWELPTASETLTPNTATLDTKAPAPPWTRDYFILTDSQGKWRWIYQDSSGQWRVHGLFA